MRKLFLQISLFLICSSSLFGQQYEEFFTDKACRIDFQFCGDAHHSSAFLSKIKQEPVWGGRKNHLSNDLNLGDYRFRVLDSISNKQIFVDGFNALFREWQSTPQAKTTAKCFEQTIQFPFPQKGVTVIIEKRLDLDKWEELFRYDFSPSDPLISREKPLAVPVKVLSKQQAPDKAVDIAIIAEGYTANEVRKFYKDAQNLMDKMLTHEPFKKYQSRINFYAIAAPSAESGISMPHQGDWKNTAVGSHFNTFYEPRYLTSPNVFCIRDYAALVPYDAIYILTNTPTYGGGGIYNYYALASADSKRAQAEVVVHEFGHSFAGLADEYFREGADVLDGMYTTKQEPWELNISSLVNFDTKWKKILPEGTAIPTPLTEENKAKIGVFEGGGYLTKGMYRAFYDCRMRTNEAKSFCPVCEKAVENMILFLTE